MVKSLADAVGVVRQLRHGWFHYQFITVPYLSTPRTLGCNQCLMHLSLHDWLMTCTFGTLCRYPALAGPCVGYLSSYRHIVTYRAPPTSFLFHLFSVLPTGRDTESVHQSINLNNAHVRTLYKYVHGWRVHGSCTNEGISDTFCF